MVKNEHLEKIQKSLIDFSAERSPQALEVDPLEDLSNTGLDSFALVELFLYIEKAYGLNLVEEALVREEVRSFRGLAERILKESQSEHRS